jgi:hypothetical protein
VLVLVELVHMFVVVVVEQVVVVVELEHTFVVVEPVAVVGELDHMIVVEKHKLEELVLEVVVVVVEVVLGSNNHFCNYIDQYQKQDWQGM